MTGINRFLAVFMSVIINLFVALDIPIHAIGPKVNMNQFELVWSDEFDGTELDRSVWHSDGYTDEGTLHTGLGYYSNMKMAVVEDGLLKIKLEYMEDGLDGGPAGWYSSGLCTKNGGYEQTYGYFEIRCKICPSPGAISDFWMNSDNALLGDTGCSNGVEIDIMESQKSGLNDGVKNIIEHNIHYNGAAHRQKLHAKAFLVNGDMRREFHTYGVEWNEEGYVFYIDGKMSYKTSFGVSNSPEYLCVGLYLRGNGTDGVPTPIFDGKNSVYEVDYIRAYQYKDKI
ncbi:MAG: glycoside hydrolase family 16 protein [Clostridia bacterium]|nr:glycoside hydrolase family 16 protein [Clostridia bacterium]